MPRVKHERAVLAQSIRDIAHALAEAMSDQGLPCAEPEKQEDEVYTVILSEPQLLKISLQLIISREEFLVCEGEKPVTRLCCVISPNWHGNEDQYIYEDMSLTLPGRYEEWFDKITIVSKITLDSGLLLELKEKCQTEIIPKMKSIFFNHGLEANEPEEIGHSPQLFGVNFVLRSPTPSSTLVAALHITPILPEQPFHQIELVFTSGRNSKRILWDFIEDLQGRTFYKQVNATLYHYAKRSVLNANKKSKGKYVYFILFFLIPSLPLLRFYS
jgi:hypothetical protein